MLPVSSKQKNTRPSEALVASCEVLRSLFLSSSAQLLETGALGIVYDAFF